MFSSLNDIFNGYLNEFENSINNFEEQLYSLKNQIKVIIIDFFTKTINLKEDEDKYITLCLNIKLMIEEINKLEIALLKKKIMISILQYKSIELLKLI